MQAFIKMGLMESLAAGRNARPVVQKSEAEDIGEKVEAVRIGENIEAVKIAERAEAEKPDADTVEAENRTAKYEE
jgi:hypothetical protein